VTCCSIAALLALRKPLLWLAFGLVEVVSLPGTSWYSIAAMAWGVVELEPEVEKWLESLPIAQFAHTAFYVDLLAEQGPLLGEPYTKQLDRKLRECGSILSGGRSGSLTGSRPTGGSSC
jgi:hypothetical protein